MNRREMIKVVADRCGSSDATAKLIIDALQAVITDEMAKGGEVNWSGLAKFKTKHRPERQTRNPQSGQQITVPAKTVPAITALTALKDAAAQAPVPVD